MMRPFTVLTILVLFAIAFTQLFRAVDSFDISVAGNPVPIFVSWLAGAITFALAVGLCFELVGKRGRPDHPSVAPAESTKFTHAKLESIKIDGRYVPAAYFMFACSPPLTPAAIRQAHNEHGRILVGFDSNIIPLTSEITNASYKAAREAQAELEIYVEGPGGPTGTDWLPDELERVEKAARSVGIDTHAHKDWLEKIWNASGWKTYTFRQLEAYKKLGFNAAEIDNLYRAITTTDGLIAFYKEYAALYAAGRLPQLIMKNLSPDDLTRVVNGIHTNELPRTMFSEFHINESSTGESTMKLDRISSAVGIRTVVSTDTRNYRAKGDFGKTGQFDVAMGQAGGQGG